MDKKICENVCEKACVVSMCLYNEKNERVFTDGLSVLRGMTPEELQKIYNEYTNKKVIHFNSITSGILEKVRTNEYIKMSKTGKTKERSENNAKRL